MKYTTYLSAVAIIISVQFLHAQNLRNAQLQLPTRWSGRVSPTNALTEYPRPQLMRKQWNNLNGLWEYAIADTSLKQPAKYDGKILVPYPLESALSGVQKKLSALQYLWYRKIITHKIDKGKKTLLHFGAVDQIAILYVNGKMIGKHEGGYTEFSFDITRALKNGDNEIVVRVYDPTEQGIWPHGKQVSNPANIYYTSTSGIWQTVWLESVPLSYIRDLKLTPDVDNKVLHVEVDAPGQYNLRITALDQGKPVSTVNGAGQTKIQLPIYDPKLWSPTNPFLYDLKIELLQGKKVIDEVTSYFGMRKVSIGKDSAGYYRIFLNNQYVYNLGTLDQGFWPDGLYTAPTDEALRFDIEAIKSMGFNTIRKHIKVEPARWYYHADRLGMLVWQDFVNPRQDLPPGARAAFEKQMNETIDQLYNHPCITTWVLFNERWGRYDQDRLTRYLKHRDPSRLLNAHSGELLWVNEQLRDTANNPWMNSDIADVHSYPNPVNAPAKEGRVQILGEFGGVGVFIADHQWHANKSWGYVQVSPAQLLGKYAIMNQHLQFLEKEGLAGSIYTQPFDVEGEENGIMTYDREVTKMPFDSLRKIHAHLNRAMGTLPEVTARNADLIDPASAYSELLQEYIDGKRDAAFLKKIAMMAVQVGDNEGAMRIGKDYIASLQPPYNEDNLQSIAKFTTSTKDTGFAVMRRYPEDFKKVMGERQYTVSMMNIIYNGDMKALLDNNSSPDWMAIEALVKPYGAPGEEILLRAKTIHFINRQDWKNYVPAAKAYLTKYGANISEPERNMFQQAIENAKSELDENKKNK